jgi:hypothetical protein
MKTLAALILMCAPAFAQSSFVAPGGQIVPGIVVMCITAGKAVPCSGSVTGGPDSRFVTAGGQTVDGRVRMCLTAGVAAPC